MAGTTPTPAKPKTHKYIVVADAVVVTIGKKANGRPEYTRIPRGGVINGVEGSERIRDLVRKGALLRATSPEHLAEVQEDLKDPRKSKHRLTAKRAAQMSGANDDPVQAPQTDVLPVPAPLPATTPGAILADTE